MSRPIQHVRDELTEVGCYASDQHIGELAALLVSGEKILAAIYGAERFTFGVPWTLGVITHARAIRISIGTKESWRGLLNANSVYWVDATQVGRFSDDGIKVATLQQQEEGVTFLYSRPRFFGGSEPTVDPESVERFFQMAQSLLAASKKAKSSEHTSRTPARAPARSLIDELERLGNLRTRGLLTDAEFDAAKHKLLS